MVGSRGVGSNWNLRNLYCFGKVLRFVNRVGEAGF